MSLRDNIEESVQALLDFGTVTASSITSNVKQVVVTVLGVEDEDGDEQRTLQILYGNAAVLVRPAAPESDGTGMEVVYVRTGDEMVPIAHRETRWQVDLDAGEVVVRALGSNAAMIRLKTDGTVIIEATKIQLGSESVSDKAALASSVDSQLDNINAALDAFALGVPVPNDGGAAIHTVFKALWPGAPPAPPSAVGSSVVELD